MKALNLGIGMDWTGGENEGYFISTHDNFKLNGQIVSRGS